jgi:hypothetical protein
MKKIFLFVVIFTFMFAATSFAQTDFSKMSQQDQGAYTAGYIKDHAEQLGSGDAVEVVNKRTPKAAPVGAQFQAADLTKKAMVPVTAESGDQFITYNGNVWGMLKKDGRFYLGTSNGAQNNSTAADQNNNGQTQASPQQMTDQTAVEYYRYQAEVERTKQKNAEVQLAAYQAQQQQQQQQVGNSGAWGQSPTVWNASNASPWWPRR